MSASNLLRLSIGEAKEPGYSLALQAMDGTKDGLVSAGAEETRQHFKGAQGIREK